MSARKWPTVLALLLGITAAAGLALQAHAGARGIRVDNNNQWNPDGNDGTVPSAFTPADAGNSFLLDLSPPSGLAGGWWENNVTDVIDWCNDPSIYDCNWQINGGGDPVLAQLYITPSTTAGDLEMDLFFECGYSFGFSVNGVTEAPKCSSNESEVDETYIYSSSGTLQAEYAPEPGAGALFLAGAAGLLCVLRLRRSRRRAGPNILKS